MRRRATRQPLRAARPHPRRAPRGAGALTLALTHTLTLTLSLTLTLTHLAAQAGVRYSLSNPQSYMRNNLQCFITLLETHRRFPKVNPNHNPHP